MSGEGAELGSDAGVGGAIHPDAGAAPDAGNGTQDAPLLEQNQTTANEQIEGILAQTHADLGDESESRYAEVLRQRFDDASIEVPDDRILDLARRAGGSASSGGTAGV